MIPIIGIMVGCYVITRMLALYNHPTHVGTPLASSINGAAIVTIVVAVWAILSLVLTGSSIH